jgi:hypothetical protein
MVVNYSIFDNFCDYDLQLQLFIDKALLFVNAFSLLWDRPCLRVAVGSAHL